VQLLDWVGWILVGVGVVDGLTVAVPGSSRWTRVIGHLAAGSNVDS
jgi:hypothetical protein